MHDGSLEPQLFNGGIVELLITPIFWVPFIIGIRLLPRDLVFRRDDFAWMAALLTLKPFLTTPLWVAEALNNTFWLSDSEKLAHSLNGIAPGAGLTLLTLIVFGPLFFGAKARTESWTLITLDCIRWGNSLLLSLAPSATCLTFAIALSMPTIFALVAWNKAKRVAEQYY